MAWESQWKRHHIAALIGSFSVDPWILIKEGLHGLNRIEFSMDIPLVVKAQAIK